MDIVGVVDTNLVFEKRVKVQKETANKTLRSYIIYISSS